MAQLSSRIGDLEKRTTSKKFKPLIDPLHSNYVTLMGKMLAAHETCARYLLHHRAHSGSVSEEISSAFLRTFRDQLREIETPMADLQGGWEVAASSLSAEINAYGATLGERFVLWWNPNTIERHRSLGELSAQVASANNHLDLLLEAHRNLGLALADMERFGGQEEDPDELHWNIGVALMVMIRLDRALRSRMRGFIEPLPRFPSEVNHGSLTGIATRTNSRFASISPPSTASGHALMPQSVPQRATYVPSGAGNTCGINSHTPPWIQLQSSTTRTDPETRL
ncbi:hypothetical protein FB45DRAFT_1009903 [Roridomyces roridus]|uniref:Uncharacterized protein n=1 Tax=Roridomyces roridus TaxID=1738132 RepID=A0AAD7B567_9AGAR|nr:hypothetical protein FB45DRAFT_1009903 [Roridomyces roridus]